jgi:hypothetical protein
MRLYLEKSFTTEGRVAQGVGPEFKPQYLKKKNAGGIAQVVRAPG